MEELEKKFQEQVAFAKKFISEEIKKLERDERFKSLYKEKILFYKKLLGDVLKIEKRGGIFYPTNTYSLFDQVLHSNLPRSQQRKPRTMAGTRDREVWHNVFLKNFGEEKRDMFDDKKIKDLLTELWNIRQTSRLNYDNPSENVKVGKKVVDVLKKLTGPNGERLLDDKTCVLIMKDLMQGGFIGTADLL